MRSIETEGAVATFTLDAGGAFPGGAFDRGERRQHAGVAGHQTLARGRMREMGGLAGLDALERETQEFTRALGDQDGDAILGHGDVALGISAGVGIVEVLGKLFVGEDRVEAVDIGDQRPPQTRKLSERGKDHHEGGDELGHGWGAL